jgi:hypothetical protein
MWLGLLCAGMLALMLDTLVLLKAAGVSEQAMTQSNPAINTSAEHPTA